MAGHKFFSISNQFINGSVLLKVIISKQELGALTQWSLTLENMNDITHVTCTYSIPERLFHFIWYQTVETIDIKFVNKSSRNTILREGWSPSVKWRANCPGRNFRQFCVLIHAYFFFSFSIKLEDCYIKVRRESVFLYFNVRRYKLAISFINISPSIF